MVALEVAIELELWADGSVLDWEMGPTVDKVKPTDVVDVLVDEDILDETGSLLDPLDETGSLLDPEASSGRNSDDEDDGARVPIEEPTG